jgi:hypothetical protein
MRIELLDAPWMLQVICGREGDGDAGGTGGDTGGDPPAGTTDDTGDTGDGDTTDDTDDLKDADLTGLKSAIAKERAEKKQLAKEHKAAAKELAALRKLKQDADDADKTELEKAQKALATSNDRVTKLAAGYKKSAIDAAIAREAQSQKFIDPDDAVTGVIRSGITAEQDEDDPTSVEIDAKTVKAAVKALAEKKKHLINADGSGGDGGASGSRFGGGSNNQDKTKATEEVLRTRYPSLG